MIGKIALALGLLGFSAAPGVTIAAGQGGIDVGTAIVAYGVAAPFAALCLMQMRSMAAKLDRAERRIDELQSASTTKAEEYATRLATLLYDGARLYQQGNAAMTASPVPSELHAVQETLAELVAKVGERRD